MATSFRRLTCRSFLQAKHTAKSVPDIRRRSFAVRRVRELGDPVLRIPAETVHQFDSELISLCTDLIDTMRAVNGAGIAAPQIGVSKRVFVVEGKGNNPRYPYKPKIPLTVFVNPEITVVGKGGRQTVLGKLRPQPWDMKEGKDVEDDSDFGKIDLIEGCLSVPGFRGHVTRYAHVIIRAQKPEDAVWFAMECAGHAAGTMQHELDHLDATLFPDLSGVRHLMTSAAFDAMHGYEGSDFFKMMNSINELYPDAVKM